MEEMDEEELEELLERTCEVVSAIDEDGNGCVRTHARTAQRSAAQHCQTEQRCVWLKRLVVAVCVRTGRP
eukprot:COSAG02_NODE_23900_length_704_cov_1.613223_1_plen_69_part_10